MKLILENESDTLKLGAAISNAMQEVEYEKMEIHLSGNLGAGKTTLVRGILQGFDWDDLVTSPSYTLCEEYEIKNKLFLHIDLYRINSIEDIEVLNLDRATTKQKIIFIEWPENLLEKRDTDLIINLFHDNQRRQVSLETRNAEMSSNIKVYYESI
jgi:tRNA threonylcarbamoyladenosine biosynthesis protein TsaE|tara:strand:- start:1665 stop:2132 length:468 start_codon:yes stop_codon:yes gene_type:complete